MSSYCIQFHKLLVLDFKPPSDRHPQRIQISIVSNFRSNWNIRHPQQFQLLLPLLLLHLFILLLEVLYLLQLCQVQFVEFVIFFCFVHHVFFDEFFHQWLECLLEHLEIRGFFQHPCNVSPGHIF